MTTLLLASAHQRGFALAIVVAAVVGWGVYLWSAAKRTYEPGLEVEVAPNRRPYFDDSQLEGPRLTKFLWWAFAGLTICAVGLPVYWLREPFRMEGPGFDRGRLYFEHKSVERGLELYQTFPGDPPKPREPHFGCEACHGTNGIGGSTSFTFDDPVTGDAKTVVWQAPALNVAAIKYRPEELRNIIVYGRAGTPMPAWGLEGGGPLNDQQVDDLVNYITSIALDPAEVQAANLEEYGLDGSRIFSAFCSQCHTQGASYGEPRVVGGGGIGPSLTGGATIVQFPDRDSHIDWVSDTATFGASYGAQGISEGVMPFFANILTPEQIEAVVDYERGL